MAPPFRRTEFDILYGQGISKSGEIVDMGVELGVIERAVPGSPYEDNKLGQGRDMVRQLLDDNPELCEELEARIKAAIQPQEPQATA